jgi:hypothetical protein
MGLWIVFLGRNVGISGFAKKIAAGCRFLSTACRTVIDNQPNIGRWAGKGAVPPPTWSKTAVFPDFANKGFGGLGSLFERSEFERRLAPTAPRAAGEALGPRNRPFNN